ncbi:MAG: GNAT family N-acetyltransferase [Propionicimonas sp.]
METQRLILRPFSAEDWRELYEYLSDPEVVRYEPYGVLTEDECRSEAARRSGDPAFWAVCLKGDGRLIGNVFLARGELDTWELGYVFNARYQGRGYALESARAAVDHAVTEHGAHRIVARCNPENHRSWRLLDRLPMRREGHQVQNVYFRTDGGGEPIWQDTYEYAVLASEWPTALGGSPFVR